MLPDSFRHSLGDTQGPPLRYPVPSPASAAACPRRVNVAPLRVSARTGTGDQLSDNRPRIIRGRNPPFRNRRQVLLGLTNASMCSLKRQHCKRRRLQPATKGSAAAKVAPRLHPSRESAQTSHLGSTTIREKPQQVTPPSKRTPHNCTPSVDIAVNDPDGATSRPIPLAGQQTIAPSARSPHEPFPPADTAANDPDGADACSDRLWPQQMTVASVLSPHEWSPPADTAVNEPDGASACPRALAPQQVTVASLSTPHE